MEKSILERLSSIETKIDFIRENMAYKSSVSFLKWGLGGVATLALTAMVLAAKLKGV